MFPVARQGKIGFDKNHVHFVMTISPRYAIADVTAQLKSRSLLQIRAEFARLKQMKCILVTGIVCQQRWLR